MSFLNSLKNLLEHIGSAIVSALGYATTRGLSDAVINAAVGFVKEAVTAENSVLNNKEKRAYVVDKLIGVFHLPESIANLAVELAVQAVKAEAAKIPTR